MSNMVVANNILAVNSHRNLKLVGSKQSTASARLSSGYRINSAADDAAGLAISEKMRAQIRGLDQASKNAQDGISLIQTAEGGMQEIDNMLQRIRELVDQVSNDTLEHNAENSGDRQKIQDEINSLTAEIDSMAERVEFNKKKVINGSYADVTEQLEGAKTALNAAKAEISGNEDLTMPLTNAQKVSVAGQYAKVAGSVTTLEASYDTKKNSVAAKQSAVTTKQGSITTKQNSITTKQNSIATKKSGSLATAEKSLTTLEKELTTKQSSLAGLQGSLASMEKVLSPMESNLTTKRSSLIVKEISLASKQSEYDTAKGSVDALNAQLKEVNDNIATADTADKAQYLASLNDINSKLSLATSAKNLLQGSVKTLTDDKKEIASAVGVQQSAVAMKKSSVNTKSLSVTKFKTSVVDKKQASITIKQATVAGIQKSVDAMGKAEETLKKSAESLKLSATIRKISVDIKKASAQVKADAVTAKKSSLKTLKSMMDGTYVSSNTTTSNTLKLEALSAKVKALESKKADSSSKLYFQLGANADQGISVNIGSVKTDLLGIGDGNGKSSLDVLKYTGADTTGYLDVLDTALSYVTSERSKLGATQNRLEYTIKSLDISSENLQASESRVRDADMAKEMMKMTQANVLQQAATAMLAQANQAPQNVLQLLG